MIDRDDPFHQTVCRLILNTFRPMRVEGMGPDIAALRPVDPKARVLVVRGPGARASSALNEAFLINLKKLLKSSVHELDVVLVGGGEAAKELLTRARPRLVSKMQCMHHVSDAGAIWSEKRRDVSLILEQSLAPLSDGQWGTFRDRLTTDAKEMSGELKEASGFRHVLQSGPVIATRAFLAIVAVMYAAELLLGAPDSAPALLRLGALSPRLVFDGELYRLFSVAALHGGFYHILFCSMVLWNLGSFLERITGTARFTLLFASSVLAGSIASIVLVKPTLAVGSSGGLWGVLAAQGVIAWFGRGVLPKALVPGARKAALINLGLNIFVSMLPHVDWGAHLGGAIAGGIIMFLMLPGLPRIDEVDATGRRPTRPPVTFPTRIGAIVLGTLLVGSIAVAVAHGRPWELRQEPRYETVQSKELRARLDVPDILDLSTESTDKEQVWGDIFTDPAMISVRRFPYQTTREDELSDEGIELILSDLNKPLAGGELARAARVESIGGRTVLMADFRYPNGILFTVALIPDQHYLFRVETYAWPDRTAWSDVGRQVAASLAETSR